MRESKLFCIFFVFLCSKSYLCGDKRQKLNKNIGIMNQNEQEFEQVMRTHKATIYTVCASAVGIFFGLIICFGFYFCEIYRVNQSVREIDELTKDDLK